MTTATQERIIISLRIPESFANLLTEEGKINSSSLASVARGAIKWHSGKGFARHPDRPPLSLPRRASAKTVQKSMLIDEDDAKYLDKVGSHFGLARTATLTLILAQYLGLDPIAPA